MNHNDQTLALHAGHNTTKTEGTRAVPIYQTTSILKSNKIPVNNHIIKSIHGHDAFLIETNQISDIFTKILK